MLGGGGRADDSGEAEALEFGHPAGGLVGRPHRAGQRHLTEKRRPALQRLITDSGGQRQHDREVRTGVAQAQPTRDRGDHIQVGRVEPAAPRQHGEEQVQTRNFEPGGDAPRRGELRRDGQRL